MKKHFIFLNVLALGVVIACNAWAKAWQPTAERLQFDVKWLAFTAGESEILYTPENEDDYRIVARAWTQGLGSVVHMRDRITVEGVLGKNEESYLPTWYEARLNENDYRANKKVVYNHAENKAHYTNYRNKLGTKGYDIEPLTRDMFSALYYLRATLENIEVGRTYTLPVFDLDKAYTMQLNVEKRQEFSSQMGRRSAFLVRPALVDGNGKKKDSWYIWVSDDDKRLPLMIGVSLPVGSFKAWLTGVGHPQKIGSQAPVDLPEKGDFKVKKDQDEHLKKLGPIEG